MAECIYADNAATTKLDEDAFKAMKPFLLEFYGNASQPYSFARKAKKALDDARMTIAMCIGATPEEVFFTSGGTESDNWAIKCFGQPDDKKDIITSQIEHHAVLNSCPYATHLSVNSKGLVSPEELEKILSLDADTRKCSRLVSIMLVNNEIGTIEPIKELSIIAHNHSAIFHTDAVQAVGHIPVDVNDLDVDMLSASAHKFNGPKGIGFLYIRKGIVLTPYANGGSQEHGMRAGTENIANIIGMATALEKNCNEMGKTSEKLRIMEETFLKVLNQEKIDFIRNGADKRVPGNINISIRNVSGEMLLHRLDLKGISISTGAACDSVKTQVSHVIKAIGVPKEYREGTIRVTFGRDNKIEDAIAVAKVIAEVVEKSSE